jgi:hypothetical protein
MTFDNPDNLDTYADRLAANGGDLEAGVLRAFAKAWQADRTRIDALQDENSALNIELRATRERVNTLARRQIAAVQYLQGQAA